MSLRGTLLGIFIACQPGLGGEAKESSLEIYLDVLSCSRGDYALSMSRSIDDLRTLPSFRSESVKKDPAMNASEHTLRYRGMTVWIVVTQYDHDNGLIEGVSVTSKNWAVTGDLKVGSPVDELSSRLGRKIDGSIRSVKVCGDTDCATYFVERGRLKRIDYHCYTG